MPVFYREVRTSANLAASAFPWIPVNTHVTPFISTVVIDKTVGGDADNASVRFEYTLDDPYSGGSLYAVSAFHSLNADTGGTAADFRVPCRAVRFYVTGVSGIGGDGGYRLEFLQVGR